MLMSEARQLAESLIKKHLPGLGWRFCWDKAKRRAGACKFRNKVISLSVYFVTNNSQPRVLDTILHEIAHALAGWQAGHGPLWKQKCLTIGAQPRRCYDTATTVMPKGKYRAVCPGCKKEFHRHKRFNGSKIWCRACGPDRGQLRFTI